MFRTVVCTFIMALLLAYLVHSRSPAEVQVSVSSAHSLDGVYEFVSESTVLTKPEKTSYKRTSSEWAGIWQFQSGYYTRTLMKKRRDAFFNPRKQADFGFESFAGPFEVEAESVRLIQTYALNPLKVDRSALMAYRIDVDTLTLVEKLHPYIEDLREGTITTVLRRVK